MCTYFRYTFLPNHNVHKSLCGLYLIYFLFHNFVDEFHEECHDETNTEMVVETIMEEQCTGKVIFAFRIKKKILNLECCDITSISNLLLFSWFCRWGSWRMYWHNCYQMHTKIWGTSCWITCYCNDKKYLPWFHWKKM